ncbi:TAXI family TRAP transporter solute-binding subunit [Metabacillus arenae]|uniref:TAXI family TRAP transporter solute-binding subunit n=1 Tax=Metabacillus arenae TaxID=2771434 RepID=A0A926NIR6_9BACI|nr:TAXI family TRAP transporter solute-binding subunit [Metabacillus arenae]MBD1381510.1 TAXI family TRAP transporter solute-binding subunit [Metabacillus arenae]
MKRFSIHFVLLILLVSIAGCSNPYSNNVKKNSNVSAAANQNESTGEAINLTWASGSLGGGWYSMAGGLSSMIQEKSSNINIRVIPGGSLQNIPFIAKGTAQLAFEQPAFITAGKNGEDPFDKKYSDLLAVGNGFGLNYFHFAIDPSIGVESIDEIFEKKLPINIAVTPVNNTDEWVLRKFLEYYGVTYEDIESWGGKIFHGSYTEQAQQFKDGNVDVMFTQLALPGSAITEASNGRDLKILPMSDDLIEYLSQYGIEKGVIPANTYPEVINGDEDIQMAAMGTLLVASNKVPEDVVYNITKTINESQDRLKSIHSALNGFSSEKAIEGLGTDLHPGAEKYYKEIDVIK